ncbi:MAG: ATP/GTP-binding protein, partial [Micrococcales bacterium]|nr:ATP/GTP-binding protein [Micrococcales bacterium]
MTPDQIALAVLGGLVLVVIVGALLFVRSGRKNADAGSSTSAGSLSSRGWSGPGGGMSNFIQPPAEWRGTTLQVC